MAVAMAMAAIASMLLLIHVSQASDNIVGCGGFVEASSSLAKLRKPSDPKLDYSHITVKLHTLEGLVKDQTQCAPNGYYFLPVYEKGSFLLKVEGPPGWSFTPPQVPVIVDQNGCNGNQDINFHYTGFTLSGKVKGASGASCKGVGDGPAGVKVKVTGPGSSSDEYSVLTGPSGAFRFENLLTGTYKIEASHPTLEVQFNGPDEVELGWGNGEVDNIFFVPGYTVEGFVLSKGMPVLGVHMFLHSKDVKEVQCPQGPSKSPLPEPALCHATSDAEGRFKFTNIPCGDYTLVPFYKGENTVFGVSPTALDISVGHHSLVLKEVFQVTGFSVGGRVIDSEGRGIGKVKIFIDNIERAITDANGFYKLDQVTSTRYTITAEKEHYKFTFLKDFMVLPNMASIPSIEATHYSLCGSVHVVGQYGRRQIALTHGPSNVKPQTKRVDESGNFCFEVSRGEYRLSPMATVAEQQAGLLFSPPHLDVIVAAPVFDILFQQAQVSVSGRVRCKTDCGAGIFVSLVHTQSVQKPQVATLQNDIFKFDKVFPGKYKLEVRKEGETMEDEWCWELKTLEVEVVTANIENIEFVQKGYWFHIKATHPTNAVILQDNKDPAPLQIKKGSQQVCLETPGIHELQFVKPCVFFGASSFTFDTSKPKTIHLVGEKYLLTGYIEVDSRAYSEHNTFENKLLVEIWNKKDGKLIESIFARPGDDAGLYSYSYWAHQGDERTFVPHYTSVEEEQVLLFYPREQHVKVTVDGCQPEIPRIAARPGVYLTGSVKPGLGEVKITVTAETESKNGRLKAGEVAMQVMTREDGTYVAGPLYDDARYKVQADKAGYHFRQLGEYSFECQKLAQIVVNIIPGENAEEILPSVLLSLSGDNGYRKNAIALPGGKFTFDSMFPGSFYLRPLLKEYSFTPAAQALELGSGATIEATFTARRTGYSVFGTVTSLSGKPEEGIYVEARSNSGGYYEETITDASGKYRLRGLIPNTIYNVQVVIKEGSQLERASPSVFPIQVMPNDAHSVDFVVFEQSQTTSLTGLVEGHELDKWQPAISVEVISFFEPQKVEKKVPLPLSSYFEIEGVPKGKYLLRLVSTMAMQTHKFHSDMVEVDLIKHNHVHLDSVKFHAQESHHKQDLAPPSVLPLLIGVSVIGLFAAVPSLKEWLANMCTTSAQMRKPSQRKRA